MNTFKRQLYTSSPKTSSSQCIRYSHNAGFTLIELLVVVSIIALLSTIVFAALSDARVKARNTAKNNLVMEYIKALELYRNDNGTYPIANDPVCFGYGSGANENCHDSYPGSEQKTLQQSITTAMLPYFGGDFAHRDSLLIQGLDFRGVLYQCKLNTNCSAYQLIWYLEKKVSSCVVGAAPQDFPEDIRCTYPVFN